MNTSTRKRPTGYFQFPLSALAYGNNPRDRLNATLDYAVAEAGRALWQRCSPEQRSKQLNAWQLCNDLPKDIRLALPNHQVVLTGADAIGVTYSHIGQLLKHHAQLAHFVSTHQTRHGPSPLVRIRRDLFFEARDRAGLSYTELAVLAALYSVIGKKPMPVLITQSTIRHRALGYKSPAVQTAELARRTDGAQPMTEWQLRRTLDSLHERKLFARFTFARRLTYYSHRMLDKALRAAVIQRKSRSPMFQMYRKLADQEATDQIRNLRALAAGKPPAKPDLRGSATAEEPLPLGAPPGLY